MASLAVLGIFCFFLVAESHAPEVPPRARPEVSATLLAPGPGDSGKARDEFPVVHGHRPLTAGEVDELETLARRLARAAQREAAALETLMLVLSREDGGLYKRAVALQALRLAGHAARAGELLEKDPRASDLELIARALDRTPTLASK